MEEAIRQEDEQEEEERSNEDESEVEGDIEEALVARFEKIIECVDDLSLQLQDCMPTVEARVDARTQARVDAMNAWLEAFFANQVAVNE